MNILLGWSNKILPIIIIGSAFIGIDNPVCYAAASGLPWDTFLTPLLTEFSGPIPKIMAIIAVVLSGTMLMFGETGGMFKKSLQIIFGVTMSVNIGDWLLLVFPILSGATSTTAPLAYSVMLTSDNFLSSFMMYFIAVAYNGAAALQGPALAIMGTITIIEIALTLAFNYETDHIKYIFKEFLKVGFFIFLVQQWIGGTYGIANNIYDGFQKLGFIAAGMPALSPDSIVTNGITMISGMWGATMKLGWGSLGLIIVNILALVGIFLSTCFMAIEIFMNRVEFWVISLLVIPLLPFGMNKHTKFLFEKATGAVVSLGIKVMVLSFVSAIVGPLLAGMAAAAVLPENANAQLGIILRMLLGCMVLCVLVKKAPELAQGLLSGSPSLGGGDGMKAVGSMASMATAPLRAASAVASVAALGALATAMPGGRNTGGGVNVLGTMKNFGSMAAAKMGSGYQESLSNNLYRMQKRNDNNDSMQKSHTDPDKDVYGPHRGGDGGAAMQERLGGDASKSSKSQDDDRRHLTPKK